MATQVVRNAFYVDSQDETGLMLAAVLSDINRVLNTKTAAKNTTTVTQQIVKPRNTDDSTDSIYCEFRSNEDENRSTIVKSLSLYPVTPKPFKKVQYTTSVKNNSQRTYRYGSLLLDNETDVFAI